MDVAGKPKPDIVIGDDNWLTIQVGEQSIELEIAEAYAIFSGFDRQRTNVASNQCIACAHKFSSAEAKRGPATDEGYSLWYCPKCGSDKLILDKSYLDLIAGELVQRYKLKRCGRGVAEKIYAAIIQAVEAAKKKPGPTSNSPIGAESTPEAGEALLNSLG